MRIADERELIPTDRLALTGQTLQLMKKKSARQNPMYKFFSSPLPPSELISKLPEFTDSKKIDPSRHSLYEGEKEIIAQVKGARFTAEKRQEIGWGLAWDFGSSRFSPDQSLR